MASRPLERYHERTRRRGVNPFVYWPVRWLVKPAILIYFRLRRLGTEHVPDGGVILASNHRSFLDPFAIGCCIGRPIYFVAKRELFRNPLLGWLLNCLGAFPIRRGQSDEESMATALALLERGQAVVIFPEGTRIRTGSLARPKRGVGLQWGWLGGLPPLRTAAVVGGGSMGTAAAVVLARAGLEVQLGCRTGTQAEALRATRDNTRYLPGVELERSVDVKTVPEIEFAGVDLVVLAVPCASLPAAVGEIGARMGDRSAVLVASKGLVPPLGTTPAAFVSERVRARAVATLAGPAHAREAIEQGASVVIATRDADLRRQLRDLLEAGGITVEATDDVTGAELAACAKNAAALATAAAAPRGANLAGAAAGRVFAEIHELALASGARSETFSGLAGTGDLGALPRARR